MGGDQRRTAAALVLACLGVLAGGAHAFLPTGSIAGKVVVLRTPSGSCLTRCPVSSAPGHGRSGLSVGGGGAGAGLQAAGRSAGAHQRTGAPTWKKPQASCWLLRGLLGPLAGPKGAAEPRAAFRPRSTSSNITFASVPNARAPLSYPVLLRTLPFKKATLPLLGTQEVETCGTFADGSVVPNNIYMPVDEGCDAENAESLFYARRCAGRGQKGVQGHVTVLCDQRLTRWARLRGGACGRHWPPARNKNCSFFY